MHKDTHKRERENRLVVCLSEDEKKIFDAKFKASKLPTPSAFLRELIVYGDVYYVDFEDLRNTNTAIARIGNNINQIAKKMNETGNVYSDDVKEIMEKQEKIWQLLKSTLSKLL